MDMIYVESENSILSVFQFSWNLSIDSVKHYQNSSSLSFIKKLKSGLKIYRELRLQSIVKIILKKSIVGAFISSLPDILQNTVTKTLLLT